MEKRIELEYPEERIAQNRKRMEAYERFAYIDKVPVKIWFDTRYFVQGKLGFKKYMDDPAVQVHEQLQFLKWKLEHVDDDVIVDDRVVVRPDFQNIIGPASIDGVEVVWGEDVPPWVRHSISDVGEVAKLRVPKPEDNILGRIIDYFYRMREIVQDIEVTFNGRKVPVMVDIWEGDGPAEAAYQLAGEKLFLWMYDEPQAVHELMEKLTEAHVTWMRHVRQLVGFPKPEKWLVGDGLEFVSAAMWREYLVPYLKICFEEVQATRHFHMCGKADHLLDLLTEDLGITHFDGFGFGVKPAVVARHMGGKVHLMGNVSPMLIWQGPKEEIREACFDAMAALAPHGGYVLCDGANIVPGTPLDHIQVLIDAAREFSLPDAVKK